MEKTLRPCGAVCENCEHLKTRCKGCGQPWWLAYTGQEACDFYTCCVQEKQLPHCGRCADFPCGIFRRGDPTKTDEENAAVLAMQMANLMGK